MPNIVIATNASMIARRRVNCKQRADCVENGSSPSGYYMYSHSSILLKKCPLYLARSTSGGTMTACPE
jgi:hypothetical protein